MDCETECGQGDGDRMRRSRRRLRLGAGAFVPGRFLIVAMCALGAMSAAAQSTSGPAPITAMAIDAPAAAGVPDFLDVDALVSAMGPAPETAPSRPIASLAAGLSKAEPIDERPIAQPGGSLGHDAVRTIVALGAVVAIAFVLRGILRKVGDPLSARRPSGVVQVLARFPFGKGQQVVLLQVGQRVLCVHHSASMTSTLCSIEDPTELASLKANIEAGSAPRQKFERELERSLARSVEQAPPHRGLVDQAALPAAAGRTETIDLTRGRGFLASLFPARLGVRR